MAQCLEREFLHFFIFMLPQLWPGIEIVPQNIHYMGCLQHLARPNLPILKIKLWHNAGHITNNGPGLTNTIFASSPSYKMHLWRASAYLIYSIRFFKIFKMKTVM